MGSDDLMFWGFFLGGDNSRTFGSHQGRTTLRLY